ncbi:MAG: hypothetical protein ACYTAN_04355 [Planctomycetota bacterium]|jgi:hypothetical protein
MKPAVREIAAKTILNRSTLGGYSLNCYIGQRRRSTLQAVAARATGRSVRLVGL